VCVMLRPSGQQKYETNLSPALGPRCTPAGLRDWLRRKESHGGDGAAGETPNSGIRRRARHETGQTSPPNVLGCPPGIDNVRLNKYKIF
jgi:hypothetical protein